MAYAPLYHSFHHGSRMGELMASAPPLGRYFFLKHHLPQPYVYLQGECHGDISGCFVDPRIMSYLSDHIICIGSDVRS